MSMLDDFMAKVSESNVSDEQILGMLNRLDVLAKENLSNTEMLAKAGEAREALIGKMNNKDLFYHEGTDERVVYGAITRSNAPQMTPAEYYDEMWNLRKLEHNPEVYMNKCEEILRYPRDVFLAEEAIYGIGKMVENNSDAAVASRAVGLLKYCTYNERLLKLDTKQPESFIENAMEFTAEKIKNAKGVSAVSEVEGYINRYSQDRLHVMMGKALVESKERNAQSQGGKESSGQKSADISANGTSVVDEQQRRLLRRPPLENRPQSLHRAGERVNVVAVGKDTKFKMEPIMNIMDSKRSRN